MAGVDRELRVAVDDKFEIYIDGNKDDTIQTRNDVASYTIPAHARIIAIKGINLGGDCAGGSGILAGSTDGTIFTGDHWMVSDGPFNNDYWTKLDFNYDENWRNAYSRDPKKVPYWNTANLGINSKAQLIWTDKVAVESVVYARLVLPKLIFNGTAKRDIGRTDVIIKFIPDTNDDIYNDAKGTFTIKKNGKYKITLSLQTLPKQAELMATLCKNDNAILTVTSTDGQKVTKSQDFYMDTSDTFSVKKDNGLLVSRETFLKIEEL